MPWARDLECEEEDEDAELSLPAALLPPLRELSFPCNVTAFAGPTAGTAEDGSHCSECAGSCTGGSLLGPGAPDEVVAVSMASTGWEWGVRGENEVVGSTDPQVLCVGGRLHVSSPSCLMHVAAAVRWRYEEGNLRRMKERFLSAGETPVLLCRIQTEGLCDGGCEKASFSLPMQLQPNTPTSTLSMSQA